MTPGRRRRRRVGPRVSAIGLELATPGRGQRQAHLACCAASHLLCCLLCARRRSASISLRLCCVCARTSCPASGRLSTAPHAGQAFATSVSFARHWPAWGDWDRPFGAESVRTSGRKQCFSVRTFGGAGRQLSAPRSGGDKAAFSCFQLPFRLAENVRTDVSSGSHAELHF